MLSASTALGPVIIIVAQALGKNESYIPASYVKWLELAGARVVPLSYHASDEQVDALFSQSNGALFPGGGSPAPAAARRLYRRAAEANAADDFFPIWGTCDGFEWMMQIGAADDHILTGGFDAENLSLPLNLTAAAAKSELFAEAAEMPVQGARPRLSVLKALTSLPLTMNNHKQSVTPGSFAASARLASAYDVLATNTDRNGRQFVAVVAGRRGAKLPFFATQFHPEKNIFEQACIYSVYM